MPSCSDPHQLRSALIVCTKSASSVTFWLDNMDVTCCGLSQRFFVTGECSDLDANAKSTWHRTKPLAKVLTIHVK